MPKENILHADSSCLPNAKRLFIKCEGLEEAQEFIKNSYAPVHVTNSSQKSFDFETLAVHCDGIGFSTSRSYSGLKLEFDEPFDGYGLTYLSNGTLSIDTGVKDLINSRRRCGLMMDSTDVTAAIFSSQCAWQRVSMTTQEVHKHLDFLTEQPVLNRLRFEPHFNLNFGSSNIILSLVQAIIDGLRGNAPLLSSPAAIANIKNAVLSLFIETIPHNYSDILGRRVALPAPRSVKRAIDFMQANLIQPLKLEDIAQASQTSVRSLQIAFRKFKSMTPMEYLRWMRLEAARNDLIYGNPATTVRDVAYKWGFAHHGMFSSRYKKLFGESPFSTLRGQPRK